jgi:hypothetical protein
VKASVCFFPMKYAGHKTTCKIRATVNEWGVCADGGDDGMPDLVRLDGSALDDGTEGTDMNMAEEGDEEFDEVQELAEEQRLRAERRLQAAADDVNFPDEVETPHTVPARVRLSHLYCYSCLMPLRNCALA